VSVGVELSLLARTALAALLGFVIGLEREYRGKSAGDRTFALLALGAAAVTSIGSELLGVDGASRTIQGVVTGVGFIGAGLIFRRKAGDIRGLTTAAGAWAATAVGVLCGVGAYLTAVVASALIIVILELNQTPLYDRFRPRAGTAPPDDAD
jgi:putative Mg2+ transporter-C (MgtC) family protein